MAADGRSDEDLAGRAASGDATALTALFERYRPRLWAHARRRLPAVLRARLAESDLVQEAWLTTSRRLSEFDDRGPGSFGRWLRGILDNKLRDQIRHHLQARRRDARRERAPAETPPPLAGHDPSPSAQVAGREDREALQDALRQVPDRHREILHLVHHVGLTLVESAGRLGITPNAAGKLYARAVSSLGAVLRAPSGPSP